MPPRVANRANPPAANQAPVANDNDAVAPIAPYQDTPMDYEGYIDFRNKDGIHRWKMMIEPATFKFDGKQENLLYFISNVRERAASIGALDIFQVPVNGIHHDLFTAYGQITIDHVYPEMVIRHSNPSRRKQNAIAMYEYIKGSVTPEVMNLTMAYDDKYKFTFEGKEQGDGPALFKAILTKQNIDIAGQAMQIRDELIQVHLQNHEYDVIKFNQYLTNQRKILSALGQAPQDDDFIHYAFRGYKTAGNSEFLAEIQRQQSDYNNVRGVTLASLMRIAESTYITILRKKTWDTPSPEQEIVALKATIAALSKNTNKNKQGKSSKQSTKNNTDAETKRKYPSWKLKAPTGSAPTTITKKGRKYHWCTNHKMWTAHTPAECTYKPQNNNPKSSSSVVSNKSNASKNSKTYHPNRMILNTNFASHEQDFFNDATSTTSS